MNRRRAISLWAIGIVGVTVLLAGSAYADQQDTKQGEKQPEPVRDCRFGQSDNRTTSEAFPSDDVFRPLMADPKQPQFFAIWQHFRPRNGGSSFNWGSVAIGENFGFYTKRQGCDGWQVGLLTGIFAQFNLDQKNAELMNTDFNVGIPLSWRSGNWSARLRYYHQSSHLGDEFLERNQGTGFRRLTISFEEVDGILSYDYRWLRLYGGGGILVHREPDTVDRLRLQWGFEARAPSLAMPGPFTFLNRLAVTPLLSADFKSLEQHGWLIDTSVLGGFEWSRPDSQRRFRIMAAYYYGHNPYGQFFINQKIEAIGVGAYFIF